MNYIVVLVVIYVIFQVLKKADMVRKNAVESILAERDILIAVRNPFVVSTEYYYKFNYTFKLCLMSKINAKITRFASSIHLHVVKTCIS